MDIINKNIDAGKAFDWGRTSSDYARFRDIYPQEFYDKILQRNLCISGQKVLDLGTGTGVLPRNMYPYGAKWTGTDISDNQIVQARRLSEGMDIQYVVCAAEEIDFPDQSFDVITADYAGTCPYAKRQRKTASVVYGMAPIRGRHSRIQ